MSRQPGAVHRHVLGGASLSQARGNTRATEQIARGLTYANGLGLFSEEISPPLSEMLGNIPRGLVHGSFLAAVADLHAATTG